MYFKDYKSARRWANVLFILPPFALFIYGAIKNNELIIFIGGVWIAYNVIFYFVIHSMLEHMYCEIFNINWITKDMMEDSIDYFQEGNNYSYIHTRPGWGRDKVWIHVMITPEELNALEQLERNGLNRHYLIGELISNKYNNLNI